MAHNAAIDTCRYHGRAHWPLLAELSEEPGRGSMFSLLWRFSLLSSSYGSENLLVVPPSRLVDDTITVECLVRPVARTPVPEASRLAVGAYVQGIAALHKHDKVRKAARIPLQARRPTAKFEPDH
ncbi:hypothetical protein KC364_g75 [Hortaea werneckii]|nr:hypothetical protein KC364_g75 [Hortaea werneckii]